MMEVDRTGEKVDIKSSGLSEEDAQFSHLENGCVTRVCVCLFVCLFPLNSSKLYQF